MSQLCTGPDWKPLVNHFMRCDEERRSALACQLLAATIPVAGEHGPGNYPGIVINLCGYHRRQGTPPQPKDDAGG